MLHNMTSRSRLRTPQLSVAQKDANYLGHLVKRSNPPADETMVYVRSLVSKYHAFAYGYINETLYSRDAELPVDVMLDNYAFVAERLQGKKDDRAERAEQVGLTYRYAPETVCHLRNAPVIVRRKAVVMTALFAILDEYMAPDWCMSESGIPSTNMIRLGMKCHKDIEGLVRIIMENRDKNPAVIEAIIDGEVAMPLANGAL